MHVQDDVIQGSQRPVKKLKKSATEEVPYLRYGLLNVLQNFPEK